MQPRTNVVAVVLACWCVLTGCTTVVSVNPIVADSMAITDARILGTWTSAKDTGRVIVTEEAPGQYLVYSLTNEEAVMYHGRLGKLGDRLLLDLTTRTEVNDDLLIPGHILMILDVADDRVRVLSLDPDTLKQQLERGALALPYIEYAKGSVAITASTAQLRSALAMYLARPGVLDTLGPFTRMRRPD